MNVFGYDVLILGNYEFNYGLDYFKKIIVIVNFLIFNVNVLDFKIY